MGKVENGKARTGRIDSERLGTVLPKVGRYVSWEGVGDSHYQRQRSRACCNNVPIGYFILCIYGGLYWCNALKQAHFSVSSCEELKMKVGDIAFQYHHEPDPKTEEMT